MPGLGLGGGDRDAVDVLAERGLSAVYSGLSPTGVEVACALTCTTSVGWIAAVEQGGLQRAGGAAGPRGPEP